MKPKIAMYPYYPMMVAFFAMISLSAWKSTRHFLSTAGSWKVAGVVFVLCLVVWALVLRISSKYKANPAVAHARIQRISWIFLVLILVFWMMDIFFSIWPAHQDLASVASRWQLVFLVAMLLLAVFLSLWVNRFFSRRRKLATHPSALKAILPGLIPYAAILLLVKIVFYYWPIR